MKGSIPIKTVIVILIASAVALVLGSAVSSNFQEFMAFGKSSSGAFIQ